MRKQDVSYVVAFLGCLCTEGRAQTLNWVSASGGSFFDSANWNPQAVPGPSNLAQISLAGAYDVIVAEEGNVLGVALLNSAARLLIDSNSALGVFGSGIVNNGMVLINSDQTDFDALLFKNSATISGNGQIVMNAWPGDYNSAYINTLPGITATIGPAQTVRGNGSLYGAITNQGLIGGGDGHGPVIQGTVTQTGAGRLRADGAGMRVTIADGTVVGGELQTANGGIIVADSGGGVSGVTNQGNLYIDNNSDFRILGGGLVNNAIVLINSDQTEGDHLIFWNSVAITGTGQIVMNAWPAEFNSATMDTVPGVTGTIGAGQTVRGRGVIYGHITVAGRISPGMQPGGPVAGTRTDTLVAPGTFTLISGSAVDIELANSSDFDRLTGDGPKSLHGNLNVSLLGGYMPAAHDYFDVITGSAITGHFDAAVLPAVGSYGPMHVDYLADRVRLTVCYANCDGSSDSPALNVNDFTCLLNRHAAGDPYANCDGSTIAPTLNVADFICFLNKYAAGCP